MGLLVRGPLAGGLLSGKLSRENQPPEGSQRSGFDFPIIAKQRAWDVIDDLRSVAEAHGCSPARIALAWLLSKPVVTSVLVGAKRLGQLEDNTAAVDLVLGEEEIRQLGADSGLPPNILAGCSPHRAPTASEPSMSGTERRCPPPDRSSPLPCAADRSVAGSEREPCRRNGPSTPKGDHCKQSTARKGRRRQQLGDRGFNDIGVDEEFITYASALPI